MRPTWRAMWVRYGRFGIEFDDDQLYYEMGYSSMKAYWSSLPDGLPYSTIAEAMAVLRAFPKMKDVELCMYPKENLKMLAKLPERQRYSKQLLKCAQKMKAPELRKHLNEKNNTHLEGKTKFTFLVEESHGPVCEAAIEKMQQDADDDIDRNQAFGLIMAAYVVGDAIAIVRKPHTQQPRRALNVE